MGREFHHLTYLRVRLDDHTLDNNLPGFQCQLEISRPRKSPVAGLSQLDSLPLEILWDIVPRLDLQTLSNFRLVNRRAYHLLGSHPQYKAIIAHARNALCGILSIQAGRWITCKTLYDTLCTPECEHCGDFGGYIYLLGCRRVCFFLFVAREEVSTTTAYPCMSKIWTRPPTHRGSTSHEGHTRYLFTEREQGQ